MLYYEVYICENFKTAIISILTIPSLLVTNQNPIIEQHFELFHHTNNYWFANI